MGLLGRLSEKSEMVWRRLTSFMRRQPDTLIVGAQKAGTSSLFGYMVQHPAIEGSCRKEVHYFDGGWEIGKDNYRRGMQWYKAHFPLKRAKGRQTRVLEATPSYLFVPEVPIRIWDSLGKVKILIVLRDPVERAISNYFHEVKAGRERRDIRDALCVPDVYDIEQYPVGSSGYMSAIRFSYRGRGIYAPQVARYFDYFGRENVFVLGSDELFLVPSKTLEKIFQFLNVDKSIEIADLSARNVNKEKRAVPRDVRESLEKFFAGYNDELFQLLGAEFDW